MTPRIPNWLQRLQYAPKPPRRRAELPADLGRGERLLARSRRRFDEARGDLLVDAAGPRRGARKRGIVMAAAGVLGLAAMFQAVSTNVLAVNFTTANSKIAIYTNYLEARNVAGFMTPGTKASSNEAVADMGIQTLNLVGLCAITTESIGGLGSYSFVLTSGMPVPDPIAQNQISGDTEDVNGSASNAFTGTALAPAFTVGGTTYTPSSKLNSAGQVQNSTTDSDIVHAEYGYLNSTLLTAFGYQVQGMVLGQAADQTNYLPEGYTNTFLTWPTDAGGQTPGAGDFGIYGQQMNLSGMGGHTFGLNLKGAITLPKLKIRILSGTRTQADCS